MLEQLRNIVILYFWKIQKRNSYWKHWSHQKFHFTLWLCVSDLRFLFRVFCWPLPLIILSKIYKRLKKQALNLLIVQKESQKFPDRQSKHVQGRLRSFSWDVENLPFSLMSWIMKNFLEPDTEPLFWLPWLSWTCWPGISQACIFLAFRENPLVSGSRGSLPSPYRSNPSR